jgi:Peptidase A4 family
MSTSSGRTALTRARAVGALVAAALPAALLAPAASASPFDPSGALRLVKPARAQLNANQSSNWFGYNAGTIERGGQLFTSITSDWTVPTASQHTRNQAESSATWIGIGGGCLDAGCGLQDATLIQTGTEQDVDSSGHPSYSAWWELVPAPAVTISNFTVSPGDRVQASVSVGSPAIWTITLKDLTRVETFSTTVPYTSTQSTAEWIEETPLTIGAGGTGQASLPALSTTAFDHATVDGSSAHLTPGEQIQLIDSTGGVIGTPSAPDAQADGFAACAWATRCAVPASSPSATRKPSTVKPAPSRRRKSSRRKHRSKHSRPHHRTRTRRR